MMRAGFLIVVLSFMLNAVPAQASVLEFFFPTLREVEPDPSDTLLAPFATEELRKQGETQKRLELPENALSMDKPHRPPSTIGKWLEMAVSEVTTFDTADHNATMNEIAQYFTPSGFEQYKLFLRQTRLDRDLNANRYFLRSFVEQAPLLTNEGVVDGYYNWLFEVPMMISVMDRDAFDYAVAKPRNLELLLTVQVGRHDTAPDKTGLILKRWSAKIEKTE